MRAFVTNPKAAGAITVVEKPEGKGKDAWVPASGEIWYKLTPTKFDVIYESLFGFTKKSFTPEVDVTKYTR